MLQEGIILSIFVHRHLLPGPLGPGAVPAHGEVQPDLVQIRLKGERNQARAYSQSCLRVRARGMAPSPGEDEREDERAD